MKFNTSDMDAQKTEVGVISTIAMFIVVKLYRDRIIEPYTLKTGKCWHKFINKIAIKFLWLKQYLLTSYIYISCPLT